MLPPASTLRPNSSLLASLFADSGLCFLRLAGNNSAGGSSSPSVASFFLRRIPAESFHTWTERSKPFKLSRCLLSADVSLSPCQSNSSKYCYISCRCFCDSPCTTRNCPESTPELYACRLTLHISSLPVVSPLMRSLYNTAEFQASRKYFRIQLALELECSVAWLILLPTSAPMLFDRDPIPLNLYLGATL